MNQHYKFVKHAASISYNAMEPYIDEKTMKLHHDRHLQTYVDNLNKALADYSRFHNWTLEQLIYNIASLPEEIQTAVRITAAEFTTTCSILPAWLPLRTKCQPVHWPKPSAGNTEVSTPFKEV